MYQTYLGLDLHSPEDCEVADFIFFLPILEVATLKNVG